MAWKNVQQYSLGYNIASKKFYFYYILQDDPAAYQIFPSQHEFIGLAEMFKNRGTVSFNTDEQYFTTAMLTPGAG